MSKSDLKQNGICVPFKILLLSLTTIIEEHIENRVEAFLAVKAVTKLLNLEQQLVLEAYDSETERLREQERRTKKMDEGTCGKFFRKSRGHLRRN